MQNNLFVGQTQNAKGNQVQARGGIQADTIISELHGRFYEQNYNGNLFSAVLTPTSLAAATFTVANGSSATLATAAASTPILGLWNPVGSGVNAVLLQAALLATITALQTTGPGGLMWIASLNNAGISTGGAGVNRKTLSLAGSQCKNMCGIALTGLSTLPAVIAASVLSGGGLNFSVLQTAVGLMNQQPGFVENLDGSLIVPPGATLGLYATTQPVAITASGYLLWEEVPQ